MSAADIEGLPSYPTEEGSGRGITLLTSPMSCTLPFVAFPVCVLFIPAKLALDDFGDIPASYQHLGKGVGS